MSKETKIVLIALTHYMYVVCVGALIPEYLHNHITGKSFAIHILIGYALLWVVIGYIIKLNKK